MHLITLAGTWFNVVCNARLMWDNTNGEEDVIVAKFEAGALENFGMFFRLVPLLEFLNLTS